MVFTTGAVPVETIIGHYIRYEQGTSHHSEARLRQKLGLRRGSKVEFVMWWASAWK